MIRRYAAAGAMVVGWVLVVLVALAVWLHYYPARGGFSIRMTSRLPFAVIPAAAALIIFVALRRWFMLGLAVIATAALAFTQAPLWVGDSPHAGARFTVMTANLRLGQADPERLADLIESSGADVVSMQEVTPEALARIRSGRIGRHLPHVYALPVAQSGGTALFSKQPLRDPGPVPDTSDRVLTAVVDLPGAPGTRVVAVHLHAPLGDKIDDWEHDLKTIGRYLHGLPGGRVIAAGDFNSGWDSARYRNLLTDGYADTVELVGGGFLPTFPTRSWPRPWVALDHVVVRSFGASAVNTHDLAGSDHRAVVVSLVAS